MINDQKKVQNTSWSVVIFFLFENITISIFYMHEAENDSSFYYICIVYQTFILSQHFQDFCPNPVISNFSIIYGFVMNYV